MNFLDAVKELSEGRCKGIRQTRWTLGTYFMIGIGRQLWFSDASDAYHLSIDRVLADDWQLVDPIPQTEEVEVVRWMHIKSGVVQTSQPTCGQLNAGFKFDDFVKLTGTITRPVKQKVQRREYVSLAEHLNHPEFINRIPGEAKVYAEWEETAP